MLLIQVVAIVIRIDALSLGPLGVGEAQACALLSNTSPS